MKVLTFKVEIKGLESKIWRVIEIKDNQSVADLAYTILATFDSLSYHLYEIKYNDVIYDCGINIEDSYNKKNRLNAIYVKLAALNLRVNDELIMDYDMGSTTSFKITYMGSRDLEKGYGTHYPYIIDGAGRGMIDDISGADLIDIVKDIDNKGYSEHLFTPGYERKIKYDYRDFILKDSNILLKGLVQEIKDKYESNI